MGIIGMCYDFVPFSKFKEKMLVISSKTNRVLYILNQTNKKSHCVRS